MARKAAKDIIALYREAQTLRSPWEGDWRMASAYCLPRHYSGWQTDGPTQQGPTSGSRRAAYDATGVRALPKFVAILNRLLTPSSQKWHRLRTGKDLMKNQRVKVWFNELNLKLFQMRYSPHAKFIQASSEIYTGLGLYGTGPQYTYWRKGIKGVIPPGFGYKAVPMRDYYMLMDDEGNPDYDFRRMHLNARQFSRKFPGVQAPRAIAVELQKAVPSESKTFEIFQYCAPRRDDYDPKSMTSNRHPFTSGYVCVESEDFIGEDAGYTARPFVVPRIFTEPGDIYGYSPAMMALPALGGVNAIKKTLIKQAQKSVDPTWLASDDGALSGRLDMRPASVVYGGIDSQGRKRIQPAETGNFQPAIELLQDDRNDIDDIFLVKLFQILQLEENPEITATQQVEMIGEKAALVAPMMGRQQSEYLGPTIEREIAMMVEYGIMPELPPELIEAKGEYEVEYTSPLANGFYAEEVAGFVRAVEMALNVSTNTQDPSIMDHFDFDTAIPEIAERMSANPKWILDAKSIAKKREDRAAAQEQQQIMEQAPAIASVANAAMKQEGRPAGTQ